MSAILSNKLYCSECKLPTFICKHREEAYPGQFFDVYTSDCCDVEIVDQFSKPYLHSELQQIHTDQLSDEVEDD